MIYYYILTQDTLNYIVYSPNVSVHDQEMPQAHIADKPMAPWKRSKEQLQPYYIKKMIKLEQIALSSPLNDCKTRKDTKYCITKQVTYTSQTLFVKLDLRICHCIKT